jgi:phosphoglycerol transferase
MARHEWRHDALLAVVAGVLAILAAGAVLRLWHATPSVPLSYLGDANLYGAVVKATAEHGWYLHNGAIGAPFGQELYDFPLDSSATAPVLWVEVLGLFGLSYGAIVNVFFVSTFAVVAAVAYLVFRELRVARPVAFVCSVLYALAPYHFHRGEDHLYLSAYYAVPLTALLLLRLLGGEPLFAGWRSRRTWSTVALGLAVGTGGLYYAVFAVTLLVAAALVVLVSQSWRVGAAGLAAAGVVALAVGVQQLPTVVHDLRHGAVDADPRFPSESEVFGLRIAQLVLPVPNHRLGFLGHAAERYARDAQPSADTDGMGTAATLGLVWLVAIAVGSSLRRRGPPPAPATAVVLVLLVGTTAGVPTLIAYLVTPTIRAWSRMGIVIMFLALLGLAFLLESLGRRLGPRRRRLFLGLLGTVLVLGVADQTSNALVPPYGWTKASFRSDAGLVAALERRLPRGALVYQLPYLEFPNANPHPRQPLIEYDLYRGYLHSRTLRWSYGALKHSDADWARELRYYPLARTLGGIAAAGVAGVYVDRFGYPDGGLAVEAVLRRVAGPPLESADRRLAFFDLRAYARALRAGASPARLAALRAATLYPARIAWQPDVWGEERDGRHTWRWTKGASAEIPIARRHGAPDLAVVVSATFATYSGSAHVVVGWPDGTARRLVADADGTPVSHRLRLSSGTVVVRVSSDAPLVKPPAPDPRAAVGLRIVDPLATPVVFAEAR